MVLAGLPDGEALETYRRHPAKPVRETETMRTDTTEPMGLSKEDITAALRRFTNSRPGLDFGNYGDVSAYRSEACGIARDRREALTLIRAVELSSMTADELREGFRAFSGRLQLPSRHGLKLDYTTGQYYPTEYRKAVAAVCAAAMWSYWRAHCMPKPVTVKDGERDLYDGLSAGDFLRRCARNAFGANMAKRWFN